MKSRQDTAAVSAELDELNRRVAEVNRKPSVEGYLELARLHNERGFPKAAQRFFRLAEESEARQTFSGANAVMSGVVNTTILCELLQILGRILRTGVLVIESRIGQFHIYFDQGKIIHAVAPVGRPGKPALFAAFKLREGTYKFMDRPVDDVEHTIAQATESLLLEIVQHIDETNGET